MNQKDIKRTLLTEKWLFVVTAFVILSILAILLWVVVFGLTYSWWSWKMCLTQGYDKWTNRQKWETISVFGKDFMHALFAVGAFSAISKVVIGSKLLYEMKAKLYIPYNEIKYKIYVTMTLTVAIMGANAIINFTSSSQTYYAAATVYVVTKEEIDTLVAVYQFII